MDAGLRACTHASDGNSKRARTINPETFIALFSFPAGPAARRVLDRAKLSCLNHAAFLPDLAARNCTAWTTRRACDKRTGPQRTQGRSGLLVKDILQLSQQRRIQFESVVDDP